jgi:hypothetical protein
VERLSGTEKLIARLEGPLSDTEWLKAKRITGTSRTWLNLANYYLLGRDRLVKIYYQYGHLLRVTLCNVPLNEDTYTEPYGTACTDWLME